MANNITVLLLLFAGVMLALTFCNQEKEEPESLERTFIQAPDPEAKTFPAGAAREAGERQFVVETDRLWVEFDSRGATVRQARLKNHFKDMEAPADDPDNWIPVIDHRVYRAWDPSLGRDNGHYKLSFGLMDHNKKLNLYERGSGPEGKDRDSDPTWVPWAAERFQEGDRRGVRFTLPMTNGFELVKEYTLFPGRQHLDLSIALRNRDRGKLEGSRKWDFLLRGPSVVPSQKFMLGPEYRINDFYGAPRAVALVEGRAEEEPECRIVFAEKGNHDKTLARSDTVREIRYTGAFHKFFACLIKPYEESRSALEVVKTMIEPPASPPPTWERRGRVEVRDDAETGPFSHIVPRLTVSFRLPEKGEETRRNFLVYLGPKDVTLWNRVPAYNGFHHVYESDFTETQCCGKIPGVALIGRALLKTMRAFHSLVGNWGVAIIMLTLLVRLLLVPFNFKSQMEMSKYQKRMGKVKPLMDAIRKKYEKNRQRMNQELMALQRKHKLTPPLMGCLPMFITMPVFIGLFTALRVSFDLRHQPFCLWIDDLSMPDMLLQLHTRTEGIWDWIPAYLNLLPILMTFLWWFQQRLMPKSDDPQQKQMQTMMQFMPIMFGFFLYNYASGMALYMSVSSLFGIIEARIIRQKVKAMAD